MGLEIGGSQATGNGALMRGYQGNQFDEPAVPMVSLRERKKAKLQVPVGLHMKSMRHVDCPQLTPPGASMTRFYGKTEAEAQAAMVKAIKQAKQMGRPIYTGEDGKKRRRQWSSHGHPI